MLIVHIDGFHKDIFFGSNILYFDPIYHYLFLGTHWAPHLMHITNLGAHGIQSILLLVRCISQRILIHVFLSKDTLKLSLLDLPLLESS